MGEGVEWIDGFKGEMGRGDRGDRGVISDLWFGPCTNQNLYPNLPLYQNAKS